MSAPSPRLLHPPPQILEYTHRIDGTPTCSAPYHHYGSQSRTIRVDAVMPLFPPHLPHRPPFCLAATLQSFVSGCKPVWRRFGLGIVEHRKITGNVIASVVFEVSFTMYPAWPPQDARPSGDGCDMWCYLLVCFKRRAPRRRPAFASGLIIIVRPACQLILFLVVRASSFRELGQARAVPIALRQREGGSKFSRRP